MLNWPLCPKLCLSVLKSQNLILLYVNVLFDSEFYCVTEWQTQCYINHLTPNIHFSCRTAPLTSGGFILYIYSTNIRTEYFKHAAHSPFSPLQNAVYSIMLPFLVPVLLTFCIQGVLKLQVNSCAKGLMCFSSLDTFTKKREVMHFSHFPNFLSTASSFP
jgi:hypothetical protein